jgi:hypothetical protein
MIKPSPIRSTDIHTRALPNGFSLEGQVSPCVFMNRGYPLQVTVTLKDSDGQARGNVHPVDPSLNAETATDADVIRLLDAVGTQPCTRCSSTAFDPTTIDTNRGGLCEACFMADLRREYELALEDERREIAERDQQMKSRGMKFRVTAWIHPDQGDDYQVDWYESSRPTSRSVAAQLRRQGSSLVDDFEVIPL